MSATTNPEFYCPITKQLMVDPVVASDGHTYERSALMEYLGSQTVSPVDSSHRMNSLVIIENKALKQLIDKHKTKTERARLALEEMKQETERLRMPKKDVPHPGGVVREKRMPDNNLFYVDPMQKRLNDMNMRINTMASSQPVPNRFECFYESSSSLHDDRNFERKTIYVPANQATVTIVDGVRFYEPLQFSGLRASTSSNFLLPVHWTEMDNPTHASKFRRYHPNAKPNEVQCPVKKHTGSFLQRLRYPANQRIEHNTIYIPDNRFFLDAGLYYVYGHDLTFGCKLPECLVCSKSQ